MVSLLSYIGCIFFHVWTTVDVLWLSILLYEQMKTQHLFIFLFNFTNLNKLIIKMGLNGTVNFLNANYWGVLFNLSNVIHQCV